jgi:protein TonB
VAATALAHLLVIIALVEGLQQARTIRDTEVFVQFTPHVKEVEKSAPPSVALVKPVVIDPVAPSITIAAPPPAPVAQPAPPPPPAISVMMLPSPPNTSAGGSNAGPSWEAALIRKLSEAKHYPKAGLHGVVLLRFTLDRDGKVLSSRIEKSSGNVAMDQEALAALARAQPLPKPPAEVEGNLLDLIVPLDFFSP